jgi:hypothetical protein
MNGMKWIIPVSQKTHSITLIRLGNNVIKLTGGEKNFPSFLHIK